MVRRVVVLCSDSPAWPYVCVRSRVDVVVRVPIRLRLFRTVRSGDPPLLVMLRVRSGVDVVARARADAVPRPGARQGVGRLRQRHPLHWQHDCPIVQVVTSLVWSGSSRARVRMRCHVRAHGKA